MSERLAADPAGIARTTSHVRAGDLVALPTDTVYGIGCRADDVGALARLFAVKRRPGDKAVPWLVASAAEIVARGFVMDQRAESLATRFWPGALTMVLRAADGTRTQAFRMPDHPVALALLRETGAMAVSSANRSGEPETYDADDVAIAFADTDELEAILDAGRVPGGVDSTVLDLSSERPVLRREGPVSRAGLESVIGPID